MLPAPNPILSSAGCWTMPASSSSMVSRLRNSGNCSGLIPIVHRLGNDFDNIVVSQQHGKLPDLMETITELKPQYEQAWLEEYTSYRLAAALGRWDAEYEYWRRLQANLFQLLDDYNPTQGLPSFDSLLPWR